MSAPPLPEAFGNYALGEFVEVVSPAGVSWLPQTAGWTWVGIALLLFAGHRAWRGLRRWFRNRYRREASTRLRQIDIDAAGTGLVAEINKLLKLAAMAAYSREAVAGLYGTEWIEFLNSRCEQPAFSPDQGRLLAEGAYRQEALDAGTGNALLAASLSWIREHREAAHA